MEVELPPLPLREREQNFERLTQARSHVRHSAENLRSIGVERRLDVGHVDGVERELDHEQRNALQFDPAPPSLARLGEHRPADGGLLADAIDMRADGRGPMRIGRAETELHARRDILGVPVGLAVAFDGAQRPGEVAGRIGRATPNVSFVEMGMSVDEQRQDDLRGESDNRRIPELARASGRDFGDPSTVDEHVDRGEAVAVNGPRALRQVRGEDAGPGEPEAIWNG